jgi:hypothetical protein|tara:strand:- start:646 stop:753 length:108 start_codon:yes stop_codon:yes gene_type:complete
MNIKKKTEIIKKAFLNLIQNYKLKIKSRKKTTRKN